MRVRCMAPALREEEKEGDEASSTAKQEKADRERIRRLIICLGDDKTKKAVAARERSADPSPDSQKHQCCTQNVCRAVAAYRSISMRGHMSASNALRRLCPKYEA
eukprot:4746505-Amphidinium_carterae.1